MSHTQHRAGRGCGEKTPAPRSAQALRFFGGTEYAMFALITSEGKIHLKADPSNLKRFEDAGSEKHGKMPYFEVPQNVLKNKQKLHEWARDSIDIAHASKAKK